MSFVFQQGDVLQFYNEWHSPVAIISDGPYGVDGFDGDLKKSAGLAEWYEPHVSMWSNKSTPLTTLWFWNTEVGWAEVHPVLKKYGWIYRSANIWDKGIGHVAGNTNTKTLRRFPVVTEICAHYIRQPKFKLDNQDGLSAQDWLRSEWSRTGLPFNKANEACGVKNAATRKYLTSDHMWYFPPADVFQKLVDFANENGNSDNRPFFSLDGINTLNGSQWEQLRGKFYCPAGVTNVWNIPALRNQERLKVDNKAVHPNQKPLSLAKLIIECSTDNDDVIWEPFGGLCSFSVAAVQLNRNSYAAEINQNIYNIARQRLQETSLLSTK